MLQAAAINDLGGKFRILAELGQGGSSRVWLAVARGPSGFNKLVVLKSMKDELKNEPDLAQMFLNEARLAGQLSHPNIVQTNEVFEHDGLPVIVMEYLDGQSLATILSRSRTGGGFSLNLQLRVLSEALAGLHAAHELRDYSGLLLEVVHRDVSPHNVFVTYDGQTKVIDFGIAKLCGLAETTESGVIRGKLHYMAPEQISAGRIDRRADIYATGVMLWEVLTGVRMWRGVNEAVVMNRVLGGKLPELLAINPAVPPRLAQLVARATALSPEDRYSTAAEFQAAIDQYLEESGQEPRPREVGDAVAKLFSDRRQERQVIIERELTRVAEQTEDEYAGHRPLTLATLETRAENASDLRRQRQGERLRRAAPWLLALGCAGALALALGRSGARDERSPAGSAVGSKGGPGQVQVGATVELDITASPDAAYLVLDGAVLPHNPFRGIFALDTQRLHTLQVIASGHEPLTRELRFDRDQRLVLTLTAKATGPKAAEPTPPTSSASQPEPKAPRVRPTGAGADAKSSDCDPPHFFDERGVKKFKPRCL